MWLSFIYVMRWWRGEGWMFACHHGLALPREFQSYHTLLQCNERVQELVLCVTPVVVISLPYQETENSEIPLNFQFHVACVFSRLYFTWNKFAHGNLFLAEVSKFTQHNACRQPIKRTGCFYSVLLFFNHTHCSLVIVNTTSYMRDPGFETWTADHLSLRQLCVFSSLPPVQTNDDVMVKPCPLFPPKICF